MNTDLFRWLDAFAGLHVLVVGDAILDSYLEGTTSRFCREAPVPTVGLSRRLDVPGGAANTAVNARTLGGGVTYLGVVGDDPEAGLLRRALRERDVGAAGLLTEPGRRTVAKHRLIAAGQILIRFDQGEAAPLAPRTERELLARLAALWPRADAVIVSDYGYGILTPRLLEELADLQARAPRVLVADSRHRLADFRPVGVTAVKPNYEEVLELLGTDEPARCRVRAEAVQRYGEAVLARTGARVAAVTLDDDGALLFERGRPPYRTFGRCTHHASVAGAGDTFVAALALALAAGAPTPAVGELASAAAAVVVAKDGTATCSAGELRAALLPGDKYVPDLARLAARVADYRRRGRRVVFTNGCFDILHRGHITYLNQAKAPGDVLLVGVNSDDSVRRLKGPGRPINALEDRIGVLAALSCIDHLTAFDENTSCNLIRALRPDVFVKGGDYTRATLPEAPLVERLGGTVRILPYIEDLATTGIIERIQEAGPPRAPVAGPRTPAEVT